MKTMPNTTEEEKLRWIKPIIEKQMTIKQLSLVCPFPERSIKYWLANYRKHGVVGLENRSTMPRSSPREVPIRTKERIIELQHETSVFAKKIFWKLEKEHVVVSESTAARVLRRERLTRKYRSRKKYPPIPKTMLLPGELVEIDIKFVPNRINGKRYYQFTAIDCATRWRYLEIFDDYGNYASIEFLNNLIQKAPFMIKAIKTDNGSNFTNRHTGYKKSADPMNPKLHPFDTKCQKFNIEHYLIDPGKPQQNGKVERSHRTD